MFVFPYLQYILFVSAFIFISGIWTTHKHINNKLDTFASKVAAIQDKYADASVGNVTGSNAVNVFLGIGVAWTIAAIYHWYNGTVFAVEPGK